MRRLLASDTGKRKKFRAVFSRFGKKTNYHGHAEETILLLDVTDAESNTRVADHVWFAWSKAFEKAGLQPGMTVFFEARIKRYSKGYVNRRYRIDHRREDFKLSHPTKVEARRGQHPTSVRGSG